MLWSRSASLMRTTRMSSAIARNIFRMFSACCCSWLWVLNFDSLVTPSTRCATSGPKRSSTSARLYSVSSGTSWSSAAVDGDRVDAEVGEDLGRRDRVGDVRLARRADLASRGPRRRGRTRARRPPRSACGWCALGASASSAARRPSQVDGRGAVARPRRRAGPPRPAGRGGRRHAARAVSRGAPRDRGRRARPCAESTRGPRGGPRAADARGAQPRRPIARSPVSAQVAVRRDAHVGQADRQVLAAAQRG